MSVDPCENFYDFACGGWVKTHEVPSDRSNLYAYGVLRDDVTRSLRSMYNIQKNIITLTLITPMDFSTELHIIWPGWSIVYI